MTLRGSCHCGATKFEVDGPPATVTACTCSYCSTYGVSPEWIDMKPDPVKKKVGVNARLFDEFDLGRVPVRDIDGKNLW